jgi:TonB family protein
MLKSGTLAVLFLSFMLPGYSQEGQPKLVRIVPQTVTEISAVIKQDLAPDISPCHIPDNQKFTAEIRLTVTTAGLPDNITLLKTSGNPCLDDAALSAIKAATFYPATHQDTPISQTLIKLIDLVHYDEAHQPPTTLPPNVTRPSVIRSPQLDARRCHQKSGAEAKALVSIIVDVHGEPQSPSIVTSSGDACIDAAALRAARGYLFVPAKQDGQPVSFPMKLEMQFNQL